MFSFEEEEEDEEEEDEARHKSAPETSACGCESTCEKTFLAEVSLSVIVVVDVPILLIFRGERNEEIRERKEARVMTSLVDDDDDESENGSGKERTLEDIFSLFSLSHFQRNDENETSSKRDSFERLLFGCVFLLQRCRVDAERKEEDEMKKKIEKKKQSANKKLNVGEKLKLAEDVERSLREIGCPLPLRAHQIVGLDSENVFPVVQWLTKRAMIATRETMEENEEEEDERRRNRRRRSRWSAARSSDGFGASALFSTSSTQTTTTTRTRDPFRSIQLQRNSVTTRTLRRAAESNLNRDLEQEGEEKMTNGCLMEFGHRVSGRSRLYGTRAGGSSALATRAAADAAARNRSEKTEKDGDDEGTSSSMVEGGEADEMLGLTDEELAQREEARLKRMLSEYLVKNDENDENASNVSSHSVAELLMKMKGDEIVKAMHAFGDDFDGESGSSSSFAGLSGAAGRILRIERATRAVARRLEMEKRKLDSKREEMDEAELNTKQAKDAYENAKKENETVISKKIELENSVVDPAQKKLVDALANMAKRRAALKKEEASFRKTCKKELKSLKAKVISIDEERAQSGELAKIAATSSQYEKEQEKRDKRVNELAKRSKKNAILSRRLDDVPHSAELAQYETRFRELKNAVTHKLRETKRQFVLYNSLAKRNEHAAKEISLLNSVKEQLHLLDTKIGKQSLRDSLRDISSAVSKTADNAERRKNNEKRAEELLAEDQRDHIEKRKEYLKLTKEFKDLCKREEKCLRSLEEDEEKDNSDDSDDTSSSSSDEDKDDDEEEETDK